MKSRCLILLAILVLATAESRGQADGFSVTTIYIVADVGSDVRNVRIQPLGADVTENALSNEQFLRHFEMATKIFRDEEHKAYVVLHGLCSMSHVGVLFRISAPGFETVEKKIDMRLGDWGLVLNLKKKGDKEPTSFSSIACDERPSRCFGRWPRKNK